MALFGGVPLREPQGGFMRKVHARFTSVGAIALALVSISTTAMAEEPASGYAPPAYPSKAGAQTHDGFYLRMGLGLGYLSAKDKLEFSFGNATGGNDVTISGTGVSGEFALGGTVAPGLVLGGASQFGVFPKPKVSSGGQSVTADNGVVLSSLGFLIDYYIDPKDGFHIQGLVGYATLQSTNSSNNSKTPSGLALSAGVGKEWWVGDEWSVGILGRVQYVNAKADYGVATEKITAFVPAVMAEARAVGRAIGELPSNLELLTTEHGLFLRGFTPALLPIVQKMLEVDRAK